MLHLISAHRKNYLDVPYNLLLSEHVILQFVLSISLLLSSLSPLPLET